MTGGGFSTYSLYTYEKYLHPVDKAYVAHSIYFSVLGAQGWPGLAMFLAILGLTWLNLSKVEKRTRGDPERKEIYLLARMLKLSLIVYMTGGAFLSLSEFDLPWHLVAIACLLKYQLNQPDTGVLQAGDLSRVDMPRSYG